MMIIDESKLADLHTADELLDAKYGKEGSESRAAFDAKVADHCNKLQKEDMK